ncbi:hypothetical protein J2X07_000257 [Fictibacillus barbaricus]|uniref:Uncharacterized protein n=1 Tax=Fictibacillus barbaricus TaxID=182136 RepID=A0ABU1TVS8_9BACL|nr:hypothetical protein [Fictibacillus barbaricus]
MKKCFFIHTLTDKWSVNKRLTKADGYIGTSALFVYSFYFCTTLLY